MKFWQSFLEALESLSANKLRSGLTILGIVIGVGAVIAMISIGRGAQNTITGSIQGIGTNLLFVMRGGSEDVRNPKPVTLGDAAAIGDPFQAPSVQAVAPMLQGSGKITYAGESVVTQLAGVTPEYGPLRNDTVTEGEFIQEQHLLGEASVAVIAPDTADKLFGRKEGIVGETVRIEGQPFRIIGVLTSKGGSGFANEDDRILLPLTTAQTRLLHRSSPDRVDMILVEAVSAQAVPQASEEVAQILRQRHRTQVGADDFTVFTQQSFLDIARTITGVLTIFLGGIAAISLACGRDRDHEYHAGFGDRAHARDWLAQGAGGAQGGYPDPVPDRVFRAEPDRRDHRDHAGVADLVRRGANCSGKRRPDQPGDRHRHDLDRHAVLDGGGAVLWAVPGQPGGEPGAGGGAAVRVANKDVVSEEKTERR